MLLTLDQNNAGRPERGLCWHNHVGLCGHAYQPWGQVRAQRRRVPISQQSQTTTATDWSRKCNEHSDLTIEQTRDDGSGVVHLGRERPEDR